MSLSVVVGSSYQLLLLGSGDRSLRTTELKVGFGSHLNKDKVVFMPGDSVNSSSGRR